ncbi:uracil-DNA glycosylase-like [Convolutriloba macropyga]|uniref:uracil-DNA glycosylase-like n=1 Tax=Convolutriloba macropyga TaxID=536237 RepID=UPI003F5243FB
MICAEWRQKLNYDFTKIENFVKRERSSEKTVYPPDDQIFTWSHLCPLDSVKVVIIGQDPYPNEGEAHGLSFSVPKREKKVPASLKNIYKELENEYGNEFKNPEHGDLSAWAQQGVLLLNAVLTVRKKEPNSHKDRGWEELTDEVIKAVDEKRDPVVFMLWGGYAKKKEKLIKNGRNVVNNQITGLIAEIRFQSYRS